MQQFTQPKKIYNLFCYICLGLTLACFALTFIFITLTKLNSNFEISSAFFTAFIFIFIATCAIWYLPKVLRYNEFDLAEKIHFWTLVLFFLLIFAFHRYWIPDFGDDIYLKEHFSDVPVMKFFYDRYFTWQVGFAEVFTILLIKLPQIVWALVDSVIITITVELFIRITLRKSNLRYSFLICLFVFLIPLSMIHCSGWIMTTVAYIWTLLYLFPYALVSKKLLCNENVSVFDKIVSVILIFFAVVALQIVPIVFLSSILFFLYKIIYQDKKINRQNLYFLLVFVFSIAAIIFDLTVPGTKIRTESELRWLPIFKELSLISKIQIGFLMPSTYFFGITQVNFIIVPLQVGLFLYFLSKKDWKLFILQIVISSLIVIFGYGSYITGINLFKNVSSKEFSNFSNLKIWFEIFYYAFILIGTLISIYFATGKSFKGILSILIFLAGFGTRFMLGFSPTVFASGPRTAFYMAITIFIVTTFVYQEIDYKALKLKKTHYYMTTVVFTFVVIVFKYLYDLFS